MVVFTKCLYYLFCMLRRLGMDGSRVAAMAQKCTQARFLLCFHSPLSGFCSCAWHLTDTSRALQCPNTSFKAKTGNIILVLCLFIRGQNSFQTFLYLYSIRLLFLACWLELSYLPILAEPLGEETGYQARFRPEVLKGWSLDQQHQHSMGAY